MVYLSDFDIICPEFVADQNRVFDWMIEAHVQAEATMRKIEPSSSELDSFRSSFKSNMSLVGCKSEDLSKRNFVTSDFLHLDWEKMPLFPLKRLPQGAYLGERANFFEEVVDGVFESFYQSDVALPEEIIHVSCTGYVSPSGGQKIVAKRKANSLVTHAYHMGCYASIPALRMGEGSLARGVTTVDIVHTEICSIHFNPYHHSREAIVVQTLFSDGFIKYSLSKEKPKGPHFSILSNLEEIMPESLSEMRWSMGEAGFLFTLSKDVPKRIRANVVAFVERLCEKASLNFDKIKNSAYFAVHPGGPRILKEIQKIFEGKPEQFASSFEIFKNRGNMSSATLPHIWEAMGRDNQIKPGTPVISLAFGPGLTIAGAILQKH